MVLKDLTRVINSEQSNILVHEANLNAFNIDLNNLFS
jgi:hypothetical protein